MGTVEVRNLSKSFGEINVIPNMDLHVPEGSFTVLVGPSGCGKSTLLRLIAGLEDVSGGTISINERDVTNVRSSQRGIAMVFQSYALYPHMSVKDNMSFGLKLAKVDKQTIETKVGEAADILQMRDLLDRKPKELSGGQRQRVAIGRAIVREPDVSLFDEPLSNLDAALRGQMRIELANLHKRLGATIVYVTHDQVEAMTMADQIVVMHDGIVEQVGSPLELYKTPKNLFVAGFIGSPQMNFFEGPTAAKQDCKTIGVRPEHMTLSRTKGTWKGTAGIVEHLGSDTFVQIDLGNMGVVLARAIGDFEIDFDDVLYASPTKKLIYRFDEKGQAL
ncbi:MAG: ABC transporter ATP-binding protein [Rhodobacteraceae bacterium]|nr:ABC transporter ATP-binding protein [Paracoccaceae bacterium]